MPRATATVSFQAIELKGSLLPASLLEQVARLQAPLQKEADYGLGKGERLRERIDAAWVRLKEIWEEYRDLRWPPVSPKKSTRFERSTRGPNRSP